MHISYSRHRPIGTIYAVFNSLISDVFIFCLSLNHRQASQRVSDGATFAFPQKRCGACFDCHMDEVHCGCNSVCSCLVAVFSGGFLPYGVVADTLNAIFSLTTIGGQQRKRRAQSEARNGDRRHSSSPEEHTILQSPNFPFTNERANSYSNIALSRYHDLLGRLQTDVAQRVTLWL